MAKSDKPEAPAAGALKSDKPEAAAGATADGPGKFLVEFNDLRGTYRARDEAEAWALFNDAHKTSYGPRVKRQITKAE